jgi:hypothetical protein
VSCGAYYVGRLWGLRLAMCEAAFCGVWVLLPFHCYASCQSLVYAVTHSNMTRAARYNHSLAKLNSWVRIWWEKYL